LAIKETSRWGPIRTAMSSDFTRSLNDRFTATAVIRELISFLQKPYQSATDSIQQTLISQRTDSISTITLSVGQLTVFYVVAGDPYQ